MAAAKERAAPGKLADAVPVVFLVGAGRSGTTWLQLLLSRHPSIATCAESHLFSGYLRLLDRRWDFELGEHMGDAQTGLRQLLTQEEFDGLVRNFANEVLKRIKARKPGATMVLDKTPNHAAFWPLIVRILPHARFIHLVRDPRAVAASMLAARHGWARTWAPRSAIGAARRWRAALEPMAEMREDSCRCIELRYEDLVDDPVGQLGRLFTWLDLQHDPTDCEAYVEACRMERLQAGGGGDIVPVRDSRAFFRRGEKTGWRSELGLAQVRIVEHMCRDFMEQYGYERVTSADRRPARLWVKLAAEGLVWRLERIAEMLVERI